MENSKFIILKMISGETLIGNLVKKTRLGYTISNPLVYQVIASTTPAGQIVKQFISFRPWCEFSIDKEITFKNNNIVGPDITPNPDLVDFYCKEVDNRNALKEERKEEPETETEPPQNQPTDKVRGTLNFNMEFMNPEDLQMFMESVQFGLDNLIEGEDSDQIIEDAQEELEAFFESNNIPHKKPNKKAKKKTSKESFDLPYNKNGDPKDPSSWSDNPSDYLE